MWQQVVFFSIPLGLFMGIVSAYFGYNASNWQWWAVVAPGAIIGNLLFTWWWTR